MDLTILLTAFQLMTQENYDRFKMQHIPSLKSFFVQLDNENRRSTQGWKMTFSDILNVWQIVAPDHLKAMATPTSDLTRNFELLFRHVSYSHSEMLYWSVFHDDLVRPQVAVLIQQWGKEWFKALDDDDAAKEKFWCEVGEEGCTQAQINSQAKKASSDPFAPKAEKDALKINRGRLRKKQTRELKISPICEHGKRRRVCKD